MQDIAFLDMKINEAKISTRLYGNLRDSGHVIFRTVIPLTDAKLLCLPNFGRKSLNELKEFLVANGWPLGTEIPSELAAGSSEPLAPSAEPTAPAPTEPVPDSAEIAKSAAESSATDNDTLPKASSLEELLGDEVHLSIVLTLLQAAKIWCASVGLNPDDGKAIVCSLLEEVSKHFQTDSKERRMLSLLAHAAMVEFSKDNYDQFNPDEVAAAIDIFCEYLLGIKPPTS